MNPEEETGACQFSSAGILVKINKISRLQPGVFSCTCRAAPASLKVIQKDFTYAGNPGRLKENLLEWST